MNRFGPSSRSRKNGFRIASLDVGWNPACIHQRSGISVATQEDRDLFKLYDEFLGIHAKIEDHGRRGGGGAGSLSTGTPNERTAHRKRERALGALAKNIRPIVQAPAETLEAMLLKIHVTVLFAAQNKRDPFDPRDRLKEWQPCPLGRSDETDVLISLRPGLKRFAAANAA